MNLYVTADTVGQPDHGGGSVTWHESRALAPLGLYEVWDRKRLKDAAESRFMEDRVPFPGRWDSEPWTWNSICVLGQCVPVPGPGGIAHFYAGTFPEFVSLLQRNGTKVTYTVAAHDREVSRREHEKLGMGFPYPHLTEEALWQRYIAGYRHADVIVCPGAAPADTVRRYGPDFEKKRIEIIPHGVDLPNPSRIAPLPSTFTVGYLGAYGPDKGVRYLLEAWKRLNYRDATLVLAGRDSQSPYVQDLCRHFGGGRIWLRGWVPSVSDFYNSISLYVQPSATEGFGLEVLEAMAYGRPVLCSEGAGAVDCVPPGGFCFPPCDPGELAERIDAARKCWKWDQFPHGGGWREKASEYTWDKIEAKYTQLWRSLL